MTCMHTFVPIALPLCAYAYLSHVLLRNVTGDYFTAHDLQGTLSTCVFGYTYIQTIVLYVPVSTYQVLFKVKQHNQHIVKHDCRIALSYVNDDFCKCQIR